MHTARPAQHTKHLSTLDYSFLSNSFHLAQRDDGLSNGTALWLGGQVMAAYLCGKGVLATNRIPRLRAIELGAGIGLTAPRHRLSNYSLSLSSIGVDVLATDTQHIISSVLRHNIHRNAASLPPSAGSIQVRELNWTIPSSGWRWDSPSVVASTEVPQQPSLPLEGDRDLLAPPFDLILSSDTLYSPTLVTPLLRTLHSISLASRRSSRFPPVYLCLERRDPALIDAALDEARSRWGFAVERIPHRKVSKAMEKMGLNWPRDDWEGIEIWKLVLQQADVGGQTTEAEREGGL